MEFRCGSDGGAYGCLLVKFRQHDRWQSVQGRAIPALRCGKQGGKGVNGGCCGRQTMARVDNGKAIVAGFGGVEIPTIVVSMGEWVCVKQ